VSGPYSEAAKGILHVKKLPYIKAKQEILGANVALHRWTGQTTAPVAAWNDEPPACHLDRAVGVVRAPRARAAVDSRGF